MDDQTIIEMYWQRNEQAITETDTKYGGRLHLLAQQILNNHEDSEECVNDTYHAAWQSIPPKKPLYFFAYLAKITRNLALDLLDYRSAQKRSVLIVTLSKELEQCLPAPNDFEKKLDSESIATAISNFLSSQPQSMRVLFVRRYWYMDSIRELAQRCHMSESQVKSRLFRMRKKLRLYLEKEGITL